jgi:hypothetical protein
VFDLSSVSSLLCHDNLSLLSFPHQTLILSSRHTNNSFNMSSINRFTRLPMTRLVSAQNNSLFLRSISNSIPKLAAAAKDHNNSHNNNNHSHHNSSEYGEDIHFIEPSKAHIYGGKIFGGLMWFWILYRLKNDWKSFFGYQWPWDHEHHHEEEEH